MANIHEDNKDGYMKKLIGIITFIMAGTLFFAENRNIHELLNNNKIYISIINKRTDRYIGSIYYDNGEITTGYEGSFRSCFIFKTEEIDDSTLDFYVLFTAFPAQEPFQFYDWVFPVCYKITVTSDEIIKVLQQNKINLEVYTDTTIKYPFFCNAIVTDTLHIRSEPNTGSTNKVIGVYNKFEEVILYEATEKQVTIDNITAPWYKVKLPTGEEGWIFGGYAKIFFSERQKENIINAFK